jgi:hypothetical protein
MVDGLAFFGDVPFIPLRFSKGTIPFIASSKASQLVFVALGFIGDFALQPWQQCFIDEVLRRHSLSPMGKEPHTA